MEQRISLITLGVADLERARAFYERLGWRRAAQAAKGVAFFRMGGLVLSLYPREELARDMGRPVAAGPGNVALAHNVRTRAEVEAVLAHAQAAGATILTRAHEVFWGGVIGHFADPDGFAWEVAWNPGFPLAEDGRLTLPD